jgi:hypothetical protein
MAGADAKDKKEPGADGKDKKDEKKKLTKAEKQKEEEMVRSPCPMFRALFDLAIARFSGLANS